MIDQWIREIWEDQDLVDPDCIYEWESIAYGWAIGKGMSYREADEFVVQLLEKGLL